MNEGSEKILKKLMLESLAGKKLSYKNLLSELYIISFRFVRKKVGNENVIDDVCQEILLSVHKSIHTFDESKPFLPWFYAIARYRINDYLRSHYSNLETNPFEDWMESEEDGNDQVDQINNSQAINSALSELPDKKRHIIQLLYVEGFSVKEVSERLSYSQSDIKVSAHRALKQIKSKFRGR